MLLWESRSRSSDRWQSTPSWDSPLIFLQVTGNARSASAMTSAVIVMAALATIPLVASAARMLWAFARDGGTV